MAEQTALPVVKGKNFTATDTGELTGWDQYEFKHPVFPRAVRGKLFLRDTLELTGMELSLNKLAPGKFVPFKHKHKQNEELYLFVRGSGQMQVDGQTFDVKEGTAVRISTGGSRTWRNNGSEDLYYIVIQAKENSLEQVTTDDGIPIVEPIEW